MAYLHGTFKDFKDNTIEVQIRSKNVEYEEFIISETDLSDVHFADNPVEISCEIDNLFQHVIKKSCTINLVSKIYLGDKFFAANEENVSVKIFRNNILIFNGFVEPNTYSQDYAHWYDNFTLNCIDYMSTLQYKYLTDEHTWAELIAITDLYTFNEYLDMMGFREMGNVFYDMSKTIETNSVFNSALEKSEISMNVFLGDGEDKTMNFEEMLNEMLKYLNLHMIQEGENFYIFDWKTIENNKQNPWTCILKKKLYDDNMEEIENDTTPVSDIILSNKVIAKDDYSSDSTNISMTEVYNQIKAKCSVEKLDSVVSSPTEDSDWLSNWNARELFMTEFLSYNNGSRATSCAGARLKGMVNSPAATDCYSTDIGNAQFTMVMAGQGGAAVWQKDCDNDWAIRDWYVQWCYNPKWTLKVRNSIVDDMGDLDGNSHVNQQKIMKLLRDNDSMPALLKISKTEKDITKTTDDRQYAKLTKPVSYMVISVNGQGDDSENGAIALNNRNQTAAGTDGLFIYNNTTAANYSPNEDNQTNFFIFSSKIILAPKINVAGWEAWKYGWSGQQGTRLYPNYDNAQYPTPDIDFGTFRDKLNLNSGTVNFENIENYFTLGLWDAAFTINGQTYPAQGGSDYPWQNLGDSKGYKQRLFWKNTGDVTQKPTPDPYSLYLYPYEDGMETQYNYDYTSDGNTQDEYKKFPVLECELKIGDKYCVENTYGLQKENPTYQWLTYENCPYLKDEDGNDTDQKKTTFTLGFDPEIGHPIIGKEYELCNTVEGKYSEKTGTAIPIKKSDALSGALSFKIKGIIGTQWDNITRRHPTLFRHTKWYHNMVNILEHVSAIWIKDFKIETESSYSTEDAKTSKNKDILYVSDEERKYIKTKDDIEFKINSQLTQEEAQNLGLSSTISVSNVVNSDTSLGLEGITIYNDSSTYGRPEKQYIDQYYNYYHLPKVIMETEIWDTSTGGYNLLDTFQVNGFGKMLTQGITQDLRKNSMTVKMRQI